jgi:N-acetylneuraminic acid mutarotase
MQLHGRFRAGLLPAVLGLLFLDAGTVFARELTFEERVKAQEAIERVQHSHRSGTSRPFEEVVPRELLERNVRTYLKESLALDRVWQTPVTAEMLDKELERVNRTTAMPERLQELYSALGNDAFLIQECLIRQVLVHRLTRGFYARDSAMHAAARAEAERLREALRKGQIDRFARRPDRTVLVLLRTDRMAGGSPDPEFNSRPGRGNGDEVRLNLAVAEFEERRGRIDAPRNEGALVVETDDAFVVTTVIESAADRMRIAEYAVGKRTWGDYWESIESNLDGETVPPVASVEAVLPTVTMPACSALDGWQPIPATPDSPSVRSYHSAVWTGNEMIVWGGAVIVADTFELLNTGARFDPALNSWTATTTTDSPSARFLHVAVWTGQSMVVWGGDVSAGSGQTGGRYDPATDSWTPTSMVGAPAGVEGHSVVWTGSRMIVWGGAGIGGDKRTGGQYDPQSDTWTSTSLTNAPSSRDSHTAVWTGDTMVIWGGSNSSGVPINTGGRYDPSNDTWGATTLANAPVARTWHTSVWTGGRMIVWGGKGSAGSVNSGAIYDPVGDSWVAISDVQAPSSRVRHAALWTGERMLVWGGGDRNVFPQFFFATGGQYDPVKDSWVSMSLEGAPSERWEHAYVFTGDRMLIWGGRRFDDNRGDGGMYCACSPGTYYQDADGDGHGDPATAVQRCGQPAGFVTDNSDCDDASATAWGMPSEVLDVTWTDAATLSWTPPSVPGGSTILYDVLRSTAADDFAGAAICVAEDAALTTTTDPVEPPVDTAFHYLVRAQNGCPGGGDGPLGWRSDGTPRLGRSCP